MAGSINKVTLVGNIGKDPEIRFAPDGGKIVTFSIATSESWKDKTTGERKDKTEWHRVVIFNPNLADICEKYVKRGSRLYLEGQLQTRKWTDPQGQERYTTEIVLSKFKGELMMLDGNKGGSNDYDQLGSSSSEGYSSPYGPSSSATSLPSSSFPSMNDEIPF